MAAEVDDNGVPLFDRRTALVLALEDLGELAALNLGELETVIQIS